MMAGTDIVRLLKDPFLLGAINRNIVILYYVHI